MNKEKLMTLLTLQATSHCSCLEHCFLFSLGVVRHLWNLKSFCSSYVCSAGAKKRRVQREAVGERRGTRAGSLKVTSHGAVDPTCRARRYGSMVPVLYCQPIEIDTLDTLVKPTKKQKDQKGNPIPVCAWTCCFDAQMIRRDFSTLH